MEDTLRDEIYTLVYDGLQVSNHPALVRIREYEANEEARQEELRQIEDHKNELLSNLNEFRQLRFSHRKTSPDMFVFKILNLCKPFDTSKMMLFIEWYKTVLQDDDDTIGKWTYDVHSVWIDTHFGRVEISDYAGHIRPIVSFK